MRLADEAPVFGQGVELHSARLRANRIEMRRSAGQRLSLNCSAGYLTSYLIESAGICSAGKLAPLCIAQPETTTSLKNQIHLFAAVAPEMQAASYSCDLQLAAHIGHHKGFPDGSE